VTFVSSTFTVRHPDPHPDILVAKAGLALPLMVVALVPHALPPIHSEVSQHAVVDAACITSAC
jgi:hypothetical protein